MNKMMIFENPEFGKVRTVCIDSDPWFVLADVCEVLEIGNSRMVTARLDSDELMSVKLTSGGQGRKMNIINESGLYSVIIRSNKPQAQAFRKWVTSIILPTIRKTGGYVANEDMFIENYLPFLDEPYRNLFRLQMIAINQLNERIRHDQPLVEFANQVSDTTNLIDMNAMAKLAREENIPIGRNRLFQWLREKGILMSNNLPYQKYIESGYFKVKESVFEVGGIMKTFQQTYVTGKGQQYIIGRLKKEYAEVL